MVEILPLVVKHITAPYNPGITFRQSVTPVNADAL